MRPGTAAAREDGRFPGGARYRNQLCEGRAMPRTPEEIIRLLHAWLNGDSSYFGTVPCLIEQDDGPISIILIVAGELELLDLVRRLAPQRREDREWRLLAEKEARRLIFRMGSQSPSQPTSPSFDFNLYQAASVT